MTIDPATLRPLGGRILVRRYTKPPQWKNILLAEAYSEDDTGSLWEAIGPKGPKVDAFLGFTIRPNDIIKTKPWRGTSIGQDAEGVDLFMLEAAEVANVIPMS